MKPLSRLSGVTKLAAACIFVAAVPSLSQELPPSALAEKAVTWVLYTGNVDSTLTAPPTDAIQIDSAALLLASQIGPHSGEGWMAFAAMSAARSDSFVASVRAAAAEKGAAGYAAEIVDKPWLAAQLNGARQAAALAAVALEASYSRPALARVKGYSYSLQSTPWAAATITSNAEFLSRFGQAGALRAPAHDLVTMRMDTMMKIGDVRFPLDTRQRPYFPGPFRNIIRDGIKEQVLALAALRILGADKTQPDLVRRALVLERNRSCFAAATRNMAQCTSANRRPYERAACIAQHQIEEPVACASKDIAPHALPEAVAALSRPSHVTTPVDTAAPINVKRGPLSSTSDIGQIMVGSEATIIDFIGTPSPQWFRVRGFSASDGSASRVDGWVAAASVKAYRKVDTPE